LWELIWMLFGIIPDARSSPINQLSTQSPHRLHPANHGGRDSGVMTRIYPLLLAFVAGGALVDRLYAQAAAAGADGARGVADAMLWLTMLVMVGGGLAIAFSRGRPRLCYAISLGVFSLHLFLPLLVSALPGGIWLTQVGLFLRAGVLLGALAIAFLGQREVRQ
jgi:hypothetical protein